MSQKDLKTIIREQYVRCSQDPIFFLRQYCYIKHPKRGKIKFDLYPFQENTLDSIRKHLYSIILKARQLGISTLVAGYSLWCMLFTPDFDVLVVATTQETAKNLVTKVQIMHDNLPSWLRGNIITNNKLSLEFSNGSRIKAISSSKEGARSEATSLLIIDEAAFIQNIDEIWLSAQATLSTGGGAIVLSTPNGVGNFFHATWNEGIKGKEEEEDIDWNTIRLHWTLHPERNDVWAAAQLAKLGKRGFAQEHDCDFVASGHTVVEGPTIIEFDKKTIDPIERRGPNGNLWIWEYPNYTKNYLVVSDVARGDGADFSAAHVIDIETNTQVAEYHGKMSTNEYGNFLVSLATEYNNALLAIENANIGWAAIQPAIDRHYPNLFYTYKVDGYVDLEIQLRKNYDTKDKSQMVPGVTTSSRTRPLMISALERYFREGTPIVRSKRLTQELLTFMWINGKAEAQVGFNDDLVMSYAIGLWLRDTALKLRQQGLAMDKRAMGHIQRSDPQIYTNNRTMDNSGWNWNPGTGDENLKWLL